MENGISILIRTFNSGKTLDQVLSRMDLDADDEIVIVDSGSKDNTLDIAAKHGARIIHAPLPFNYSRTLNAGFSVVRNPWVLVISSHCIPTHSGLLARMREVVSKADPRLVVAYGKSYINVPRNTSNHVETGGIDEWKSGCFHIGGNVLALYRTETWKQYPFDERLLTSEDMAWFISVAEAGYRAAVVHDAMALYRNQGSLRHMFRKGWVEAHLAKSMSQSPVARRHVLKHIGFFLISLASLGKMLIGRRIPPSTFLRQAAHECGSHLASVFPRKNSTGTAGLRS